MAPNVLETLGTSCRDRAGQPSEDWIAVILPAGTRIAGAATDRSSLRALASELPEGAALAVAVAGGGPPERERAPLAVRAARSLRLVVAAARMRLIAAAVGARIRSAGLRPERVDVGRPSDGYALGLRGRRLRLAPKAIVLGLPEQPARSILERAIEAAGRALTSPVDVELEQARVLASGVVMAELTAADSRWLLRVAGRTTGEAMASAEALLDRLLGCRPPPLVRERLVAPVARGTIGAASWSLEPRRPGEHPRQLDQRLWAQCTEFLVALLSLSADGQPPVATAIAADVGVLEPHLDPHGRRALAELERRLVDELGAVRRGWGHGDLHPGNLLVAGGELATVLDWDAAASDSLPLLDLLHLIATSQPALRTLPHGLRCTRGLWPLAEAGGDERIDAYCRATGTPADRSTLLALAHAYWLTRVARDLRGPAAQGGRDDWLELNLRRPLAELGRAGAGHPAR